MKDNYIPKKIHYCWFGKGKKSKLIQKCIKSWKKMCPDYEIIEWNEENYDINSNKYLKEAYDNKKWAFVTDYVRLDVVNRFGGFYLDTDVELIRPLDEMRKYDSFFCYEKDHLINTGLGFGSKKNTKILSILMDSYKDISFVKEDGSFDLTPCTIRNTKTLADIYNCVGKDDVLMIEKNVAFLPREYFCPFNVVDGTLNITDNTIAIHWYNASWVSDSSRIKTKISRFVKRMIGIDNFNIIKKLLNKK